MLIEINKQKTMTISRKLSGLRNCQVINRLFYNSPYNENNMDIRYYSLNI